MATVEVDYGGGRIERVELEEYVKGVVPYEMATGWPPEALKAQAVAARSYGVAAGRVFPDTRSQVYGPLRYADTSAAVEAVRGLVLTFERRVVMPFYFGHCNGWTRTPVQAGWAASAERPYLRPRPCECGRTRYFGHGIGMCQRGAEAMARRGADFEEVLAHYYPGTAVAPLAALAPPVLPANAVRHLVRPGDTLSAIARRYGSSIESLAAANPRIVDVDRIEAGWWLIVPRSDREEGPAGAGEGCYVVQPGDTLSELARRWDTSVSAIASANGIADPDVIRAGQRLARPRSTA